MKNSRVMRINDEIMREVSAIIRRDLKDPRVGMMTSVTKVDTTNDLSHCKIHISVLGTEEEKEAALAGLKSAAGFIRKQVASSVNLRQTPQLHFLLDDSVEYSMKIEGLLRKVNKGENLEG